VPVGTATSGKNIFMEVNPSADVSVVSNHEFSAKVRQDAMLNIRTGCCGKNDARARKVMGEIYRPLYLNQ